MKIASLNCRGLARPEKKLALRKLFQTSPVNIILLQETLGLADSISLLLEAMLAEWWFFGIDANRRSGGLAMGFNT